MNFISKNIFVFILALISWNLFSQTHNFKNYNVEDGLAQSQVLSVCQDRKGYMWFGTNGGGVSKFDGKQFHNITTNEGLVDNIIFSILEVNDKELLFGTSKGLSCYDGIRITNFNEKQGLKNPLIYKLVNDGHKTFIGTQEGVYLFENNKITPFEIDAELSKSSVYTIFIDKKNNIWFGTLQNGVIFYNVNTKEIKHFKTTDGLNGDYVFSISQKENNDILIGTEFGLNIINSNFNITKANEIPGNDNFSINCLIPTKSTNEFYLGTHSEGIKKFNFNSKKITAQYNKSNGLTNNPIQCLFIDRENNLWIGTNGSGVFKYFNDKIVSYSKTNGFTENYINSVATDNNNNIWVGLKKNGLVRISNTGLTKYLFDIKHPQALCDNDVNAILPLANGRILFGTSDGLCYFENETINTIQTSDFNHKYIFSLYEDSEKHIWIGTTEGVYKLIGNEITKETSIEKYKKDVGQFSIFFTLEDKQKRKWFGTEKGLIQLDGNKSKIFNKENKFISSLMVCGVVDEKKNIWFGTEEGLYLYDYIAFKKIGKTYGVNSAFINLLQIDNNNQLIIGTNNGIDILDLNSFYKRKSFAKHLGKDDGLISLESNFNASCKDRKGRILIGTINGLEIYDSKLNTVNLAEPKTRISDIKLFFGEEDILKYSESVDSITLLPKNLILPFSKNNLTFQFIGISLVAPEKVLYQYQLEGLGEDWTPAVSLTEATYPSLPPGKYTFKVKAMNNDGFWNKEPTVFSFEILPPWYKTWWFYLICIATLIGSITLYNYTKTKKLIADKVKLENEVNERTKELRDEKEKVEVINKDVIQKKAEIEHKNIEITDSIKYAKNIQEALLPSLFETENAIGNCFILYMPKDIVSGDFFWFYQIENKQFIAAADCTGHGVPGAFMSIIGNTLLNQIVEQKKIHNPGDILLELHKGVKIALNQTNQDSERRDGMDIALCVIDLNTNVIEYSGANRPLWIYRKNKNFELEVIKPNKFPIGGIEFETNRAYTQHSVEVFEDDCIYLFSDGFADQFGGPRGKKFMIANMQQLLLKNIDFPMSVQKKNIKSTFDSWKHDLEQVDDVCVIGIRI
ncbi:MAG: two-component regulator propeller domain-containing protein [Bacteroidota bacterium]|nr:two-component regulator propeller domain-containing protein [Bacteroidota bacterium]MDP3144957.1 two-component regulator propeller domain-containing protein [Bacteroidota bacterium]MDP3555989.1 two-component regulator propeller domain-containing protein [Bacteroidota bacterium]